MLENLGSRQRLENILTNFLNCWKSTVLASVLETFSQDHWKIEVKKFSQNYWKKPIRSNVSKTFSQKFWNINVHSRQSCKNDHRNDGKTVLKWAMYIFKKMLANGTGSVEACNYHIDRKLWNSILTQGKNSYKICEFLWEIDKLEIQVFEI